MMAYAVNMHALDKLQKFVGQSKKTNGPKSEGSGLVGAAHFGPGPAGRRGGPAGKKKN